MKAVRVCLIVLALGMLGSAFAGSRAMGTLTTGQTMDGLHVRGS